MNEFLQRLKQRKLVQWAVAYVAAAFALLQGIDIVAQRFGWPEQTMRFVIIALSVGLFVTLVLAWYHGERGAQRVGGTELLILALLLAIGGGFLWQFAGVAHDPLAKAVPNDKTTSPRPVSTIPDKSIAVLPFENLSSDKDNAYFASGMQDEILMRLAAIHDLKVISRTSTEQYASRPPNLKIVAEQLGVATVLEGSVQRAEGKVRINLQLIDARSDSHLWAQNYDRDLEDVFAVQSDVAEKVADALQAKLLPAESVRIANMPTKNPQAYDRFLKAEYFLNQIDSSSAKDPVDVAHKAAELYDSAIVADPDFALAYARLAYLKVAAYWKSIDASPETLNAAQAAVTRALALQPNLPEAHLAMGYLHYWGRRDFAAALTEFATAYASLPNDANVLKAIAFVHRRQGHMLQTIQELEQAAALDPRDTILPSEIGITLASLRRYTEAEAAFDRSLALSPDNIETHINRAVVLQLNGDLEAASRALAAIPAGYDPQGSVSLFRFNLALAMRQPDAALATIAQAPALLNDMTNEVLVPVTMLRGEALALKGETGPARAAFLKAQEVLEGALRESREPAGIESYLSIVLAGLGQKEAALAAGRRATELLPLSQDVLGGVLYLGQLAMVEAQVGETESALNHLEQLLAAAAGWVVSAASLRLDPVWDPLRKDSRFQKLIADGEAAQAQAQTKP